MTTDRRSQQIVADEDKAFRLCCKGKTGLQIAIEEEKWLRRFYKANPNWYAENRARIFQGTKPVGS
jgi:hypothetical protein